MTFGAMLGSVELGLIYSIMALGVFLSFRTLNTPDLTADTSFKSVDGIPRLKAKAIIIRYRIAPSETAISLLIVIFITTEYLRAKKDCLFCSAGGIITRIEINILELRMLHEKDSNCSRNNK
jgi:hypothetical protein